MARIAAQSLAHLEPVELLGKLYPDLTYGDRVVCLLMLAELRRSGQMLSVDALVEQMRGSDRRYVQRMLARLYDCGAMTRGSYHYAAHVSLEDRVFEVFPWLRLLEGEHVAA